MSTHRDADPSQLRTRVEAAWEDRSLVFWDNRSTKHLAVHDVHDHRRVMRRIQIAGDAVV